MSRVTLLTKSGESLSNKVLFSKTFVVKMRISINKPVIIERDSDLHNVTGLCLQENPTLTDKSCGVSHPGIF